jgi:hypothetical protein
MTRIKRYGKDAARREAMAWAHTVGSRATAKRHANAEWQRNLDAAKAKRSDD